MKTKSEFLKNNYNITVCEFKNIIIEKLKERKVYPKKARICKYKLLVNDISIPYRNLKKWDFDQIIDFYIDDIASYDNFMEKEE